MRDRTICWQDAGSTLGVGFKTPLNRYHNGGVKRARIVGGILADFKAKFGCHALVGPHPITTTEKWGKRTAAVWGYLFSVVGTSRCDVRAACSGATPSSAIVAR